MANKGVGRGGPGPGRGKKSQGPRQPASIKRGGARPKGGGGGEGRRARAWTDRDSPAKSRPVRAASQGSPAGPAKRGEKGPDRRSKTASAPSAAGSARGRERGLERPWKPTGRPVPAGGELRRRKPAAPEPEPVETPGGAEDKVVGINPVLELMRSGGRPVDAVFIDSEKGGRPFSEIVSLARKSGVQVRVVPRKALDNLSGGLRHQGVVAAVVPKAYADTDALVERALKKDKFPLLVVLDGVEDPQNLGAIIRTAESAGADGIIIPEHRAAHLTSAVARASAGALEHMPVAKVPNLQGFLESLKEKGFWIAGLAGEADKKYTEFDMNVPLALVMGGEGGGIRPVIKKACDALLSLPMLGKVSSLNVSVAAGIILYEVLRQRKITAKASEIDKNGINLRK